MITDGRDGASVLEVRQAMVGTVFNIMRFCVHDGPGIRTTVFLKGCPLRCIWCHNPESLSPRAQLVFRSDRCLRCGDCLTTCPHGAIAAEDGAYVTHADQCAACGTCVDACVAEARDLVGRSMSVEGVMREVEKDGIFYEESGGGVTFSGGEPLLQFRFLLQLLHASRERGFHTAVDTSGYASPVVLRAVSESCDLFLYDIKAMDDGLHQQYTGVSNGLIQGNLSRLASWGKKVIIRHPVIPGLNDSPQETERLGRFISTLGNVLKVQVLPYHEIGADKYARLGLPYALPAVAPPSSEELHQIAETLGRYHPAVSIGG